MIEAVDESLFRSRFEDFNRVGPGGDFSYAGLRYLFEYLTSLEEDCGKEIELDVIAICCDFSESTIDEALSDTGLSSIDELEDHTTVIGFLDGGEEKVIWEAF